MAKHGDLTSIHQIAYIQSADPNTSFPGEVVNGDGWVDTTTGPPHQLKVRIGGAWVAVGSVVGFSNPMTTPEDIIKATTGGAPVRIPVGANNSVLGVSAGIVGWYALPAGFVDPQTAAGDMIMRNAANALARLPIGTVGQTLRSRGGTLIPVWEDTFASIAGVIDGGGAAITTGFKFDIEVPFDCVITRATLLADQTGNLVVDLFKCTYANFDAGITHPAIADKITASAPPTLTAAYKSQDSTLTGWTTTLSGGDIIRVNVNSCATITRASLSLRVRRS